MTKILLCLISGSGMSALGKFPMCVGEGCVVFTLKSLFWNCGMLNFSLDFFSGKVFRFKTTFHHDPSICAFQVGGS